MVSWIIGGLLASDEYGNADQGRYWLATIKPRQYSSRRIFEYAYLMEKISREISMSE